ncbi:MAG: LysR family transcriptional regulator [Pseudomonadota bacterium]
MDRFRQMETFVAVAEAGGFAAAARRLGTSAPTVTRRVAELEARLGARLLARTTRQVRLTEAGRRYEAEARAALTALGEAEAAAAGAAAAPVGRLRVTAPVTMGRLHFAPVLRDWLTAHPKASAEAVFLDRFVDMIGEDFDLALRIGPLADSGFRAVQVGEVRRILVAAPSLVAERGAPRRWQDLADWPAASRLGASRALSLDAPRGGPRARLALTDVGALLDAAEAGWAVARCLSYQAADALRDGRLVELLPDLSGEPWPVRLVHAEGRRASGALRSFLDFAAPRLRASLGAAGAPVAI